MSEKTTSGLTILHRSVCLVLTCKTLGNFKSVKLSDLDIKKGEATIESEKRRLSAHKQLVRSPWLSTCLRIPDATKAFLRSIGISSHRVFGNRTYLIPNVLLTETDQRLEQFVVDLDRASGDLVDHWDEILEESKSQLGVFYDQRDFATKEEVSKAFAIDWNYVSFNQPEQLSTIDRAVAEAAQARNERRMEAAYDVYVDELRDAALTVVKELANKLAPHADGRQRVIRTSVLDGLKSFVDLLPKRNIVEDEELPAALQALVDYSKGLDAAAIRESETTRDTLHQLAADAVKTIDHLVTKQASRAIRFAEEVV